MPTCSVTLLRRLRVQFAAGSFVLGRYAKNFQGVLKDVWLPITEKRDINLLKSWDWAKLSEKTKQKKKKKKNQECQNELRSSTSNS